jgi:hypothetical protein
MLNTSLLFFAIGVTFSDGSITHKINIYCVGILNDGHYYAGGETLADGNNDLPIAYKHGFGNNEGAFFITVEVMVGERAFHTVGAVKVVVHNVYGFAHRIGQAEYPVFARFKVGIGYRQQHGVKISRWLHSRHYPLIATSGRHMMSTVRKV